jgi:hypothetical protein
VDNRRHPIYVDGPLEGQDFPADPGVPAVQAIDYGTPDAHSILSGSMTGDVVTYELHQFGFHCGGKAVSFWVGWCSPGGLDAVTVFRALCKPEMFERAELLDMPPRVKL